MIGLHQPAASPPRCWPLGEGSVQANSSLRYEDLTWRARFGCKGPQAETWLSGLGFDVPREPNSALIDAGGALVARLARSEFLIEAVDGGLDRVGQTTRQLQLSAPPAGVYPVARQDVVIGIEGSGSSALLRQICSVDFTALLEQTRVDARLVVLTSMVGVGVVAWPRRTPRGASLTLWLDPSFGQYFCATLLEVGRGVGGPFSSTGSRSIDAHNNV